MKAKLLIGFLSSLAITVIFLGKVSAATFNPNNVISDALFNNASSMNAAQIDNFINLFPASCISQDNGFSAPDPTGYSPSNGFSYGSNVTAGQVIYDAAQTYGINPQVLLATIEKEQSLVTGGAGCSVLRYAGAAGYGCPDGGTTYSYSGVDLYTINGATITSVSGTCVNTALKVGFSQQIIRAAWLLKFGEQRSEGNIGWDVQLTNFPESGDSWKNSDDPQSCYGGPMTRGTWQICPKGPLTYYDGYTTIDGTSVQMDDGATAALYWYTPHLSGNQSFFNIFTSWFGYSNVDIYPWEVVQESGGDGSDWLVVGSTKRWIPTGAIYADWGLNNYPIQQVSAAYFDSVPTIPQLGRLGQLSNGQYVFVTSGQKYIFSGQSAIADWGYSNSLELASPLYSVLSAIQTAGYVNQFVLVSTNYYLMSAGILYPISSSYLDRWQITDPTTISANSSSLFTISSQLDYRISITGENYIVDSGQLLDVTSSVAANAYSGIASNFVTVDPSILPFFTIQQASQLVTANGSSAWEFLMGGQQHYVLNANIAKAWGVTSQPQIINADLLAEFTQGVNLSTQVEATDTGNYYILDGAKHLVSAPLVPDWFGSTTTAMQVTESEIIDSQGPNLTSPIFQVNGTSNIFTVMNGQYYYIQTKSILNGYGYPSNYQIANLNQAAVSYMNYGGPVTQFLTSAGTTYYLQDGTAYPISSNYVNSWTNGATESTYPGADFTERFNPSSVQLTNLISDSTPSYLYMWVVDNGTLLNANVFSDVYSFANWSNINISDLPVAGTVTYLARSSTTQSDTRIWLINHGSKQWVTNLEEFDGYGGRNVPITPLSDSTLNTIPTATQPSDPSIIIQTGTSGLKLLMNGEYYSFPDTNTLINVVGSNPVTNVSQSIYNALSQQAGTITRLIKDSSTQKIYYMENGEKCWITNAAAFSNYASIPITTLPSEVVNWFPLGPPIN